MILKMVTDRFGKASAGEGDDAHLWNLGSVVVATRYEPTRGQLSLMYMKFDENRDPIKCAVIVRVTETGAFAFVESVCPK